MRSTSGGHCMFLWIPKVHHHAYKSLIRTCPESIESDLHIRTTFFFSKIYFEKSINTCI
jgi:hypothetical protein